MHILHHDDERLLLTALQDRLTEDRKRLGLAHLEVQSDQRFALVLPP
jgi:hypothetical protein